MSFKKTLGGVAAAWVFAGSALAGPFPERPLSGVIQWGAGGATDVVARAVTPHAEEKLGRKIVLTNKAGAAGAIATNAVNMARSDGYTLLYGAENPQLHGVLGLGELDYSKFYPVNILGRGVAVIVANKDKPWNNMKDLLDDAAKNPGKIKMGATGPGGLPHSVGAMLSSAAKLNVISVPFDGDGPGLTALQGGHVDFMPVGVGAVVEHIKAGRVKALAVFNAEPLEALPGVEPITATIPELGKFLPWGPFYGVFVKADVPDEAKARLTEAFRAAAAHPQFAEFMAARGNVVMNISGEEASAYLRKWQSVTAWTLFDAGAAKRSPAELNIARP
jgi:tripartite-type tricarboxylate transporter receptor subunit TctC